MPGHGTKRKPGAARPTASGNDAIPFDRIEVETLVAGVLDSTASDRTVAEIKLYRELEGLALYIEAAKAEIAALSPDDISSTYIPKVSGELDAIVDATENATNVIMSAAERIERLRGEVDGSVGAVLGEAVTTIYEACGFQDIAGQRIAKVVIALKHIDEKVTALVKALGGEIARYNKTNPSKKELAQARAEKDVLNGPQLATDAKTQAEIDALLASFD